MLHTDIEKHLQELSLEDTLALAQLALEQAKKKAKSRKSNAKKMPQQLLKTLKKYSSVFPKGFRFDREDANES